MTAPSSEDLVRTVLAVVAEIPPGRVMTYGDVAGAMGSRAPRAVGRVLALHGHTTHWWRVVPASGKPPAGHEQEALAEYRAEGTALRVPPGGAGYRIALRAARLSVSEWPGESEPEELPPLPPSLRR